MRVDVLSLFEEERHSIIKHHIHGSGLSAFGPQVAIDMEAGSADTSAPTKRIAPGYIRSLKSVGRRGYADVIRNHMQVTMEGGSMKQYIRLVLLLVFLVSIVGCNDNDNDKNLQSLLIDNERLISENQELVTEIKALKEQLNEQTLITTQLTEENQELQRYKRELSIQENQIKYDVRIPLDVFEVIQIYFSSMNSKDLIKLKKITATHLYESRAEFIQSDRFKELSIEEMNYQTEYDYVSKDKITETIIVRVKYQEYDNNFALQNTNKTGWKIVDID